MSRFERRSPSSREKALTASGTGTREEILRAAVDDQSKYVEFKSEFDLNSTGAWCEVVKDFVAMANTGGGIIVFGLNNTGKPTAEDVSHLKGLDPATVADKVHAYTGQHFSDFEIVECAKRRHELVALLIEGTPIPLVFQRPGTYPVPDGKQKTAFSKGTVYFRHGAKSEPGTTEDLRRAIERQLEIVRKQWVQGVRRVVTAPSGSRVAILPGDVRESISLQASPIRIVDDPSAPAYRKVSPDDTHPFRQTELIVEINKRLPDDVEVNPYDLLAVRRTQGIEDQARYCYQPKFGTTQYSQAFVDWIINHYRANPGFFQDARAAYYDLTH